MKLGQRNPRRPPHPPDPKRSGDLSPTVVGERCGAIAASSSRANSPANTSPTTVGGRGRGASPRVRGSLVAVLFAFLFSPALLSAQPPAIRANAEADKKTVTLSDSVRITFTIEGPAPLRVEPPKQLLTADANSAWRIRSEGTAALTSLPNGRELWRQVYRLDPYIPGELIVTFAPFTVNGQLVGGPAIAINVTKTVAEADPNAARPVTPPEDVPPPPITPPTQSLVLPWIAAAVGLMCVLVVVAARMRSRRAKPVLPGEWAITELTKLEASEASNAEMVERIAEIVRMLVERRFAIPATKLTTAELLATAAQQGWPVEQADPLRGMLDDCDRAKFAGDVPDDDGCRRLIRVAIDWVNHFGRPSGPG